MREEIISQWTTLKVQFNQLAQWKQVFPNENASQVRARINTAQEVIHQRDTQITNLTQHWQINYNNLSNQLTTTSKELEKEKGWWDKWMNNNEWWFRNEASIGIIMNTILGTRRIIFKKQGEKFDANDPNDSKLKESFKKQVYQYYRDR